MIRGIERRNIFRNTTDREDFVARLAKLLPETQTACFAWALMPNHVHLLLRTGATPLPTLMRRLLTGYAVRFNRRHKRRGVLFQNRYKSVVCQEDLYFKELVRYIHLNPLRARIVASLPDLDWYPYGGHSVLLGKARRPWQATEYVLGYFGNRLTQARQAYGEYVSAGEQHGRRDDLTGGGLIRSLGGWAEVKKRRGSVQKPLKSDERILGESEFVERVLARANERYTRQYDLRRRGIGFQRIVERVAEICQLEQRDVVAKGRQRQKVTARSLLCYWAVRELGLPLTALARQLGMSPPGVGYAVQRGEVIARQSHLELAK
jgi:REP element-mobilizing transposase RayT